MREIVNLNHYFHKLSDYAVMQINFLNSNEVIENSMIGTDVTIKGQKRELSMGSFSTDI